MQQNEITVVPPPPAFSPTTSSIGYIDFEESDDEEYTEYGYDDMKYAANTTCSPTKKEKQKKRSPRKQGSKRSPESQGLIRRSDSRFSSRSLKMNFSPNKRKKSGGSVGSTSSHKIEIPDACNNIENKPDKVSRRMSIKQNLHSIAQRVRRSSQWNMGFGTKGDPETGVPPQKPSTKERFYQIAIAMCYLLIAIIAIVVTYSMIANLVHSLQHPVRSIKYNKVKEQEAPGRLHLKIYLRILSNQITCVVSRIKLMISQSKQMAISGEFYKRGIYIRSYCKVTWLPLHHTDCFAI